MSIVIEATYEDGVFKPLAQVNLAEHDRYPCGSRGGTRYCGGSRIGPPQVTRLALHDCPDGAEVFLDANIVYYHFAHIPPLSDPCSDFLLRIAERHVVGRVTVDALSDAVHKVMLAEATVVHHLDRAGLVRQLREHPE